MKIGIDVDGVILDSEPRWRVYEEIFSIEELKGKKIKDKTKPKFQGRYDWSIAEEQLFREKYFDKVSKENQIMPVFLHVYEKIKQLGHKLVIISARGIYSDEMIDDVLEIFKLKTIKTN